MAKKRTLKWLKRALEAQELKHAKYDAAYNYDMIRQINKETNDIAYLISLVEEDMHGAK